jgi:Phosphatidate cytidylyltransferase, mitochondrial
MNNDSLEGTIERQLSARSPDAVVALGETLRARFGSRVQAVLFYGSCRRADDVTGGIVDLYVLVDDYRAAYAAFMPALANRILAPNVYYLEIAFGGDTARAKYAVISLEQFERGTSRWFHPYLWGRFAQPCGLLYAADAAVRHRVVGALAAAIATFAARTLPRLPAEFDDETFWTQGLHLTYAAELRSEPPARVRALHAAAAAELGSLSRALARTQHWPAASASRYRNPSRRAARWSSACGWTLRRVQGKVLSVLRLLKASYTFDGGLQYIAWKIERHSGVKIEITPFMRRFPRLGGISALWRTWRRGGVR